MKSNAEKLSYTIGVFKTVINIITLPFIVLGITLIAWILKLLHGLKNHFRMLTFYLFN